MGFQEPQVVIRNRLKKEFSQDMETLDFNFRAA